MNTATPKAVLMLEDAIVHAWRRLKKFAVFVTIMYSRRYGRYKQEKC